MPAANSCGNPGDSRRRMRFRGTNYPEPIPDPRSPIPDPRSLIPDPYGVITSNALPVVGGANSAMSTMQMKSAPATQPNIAVGP